MSPAFYWCLCEKKNGCVYLCPRSLIKTKPINLFFFSALIVICASQRSPYAGRRPIGYPALETTTSAPRNDSLGNRFGENGTTTTQRLPVEALGDKDLFNRLGQLPQDKQPFWYINWQALEQHRQQPQSYPQKPNIFAEIPVIPIQTAQTIRTNQSGQIVRPGQSATFIQNAQTPQNASQRAQNNQTFG